MGHGGQCLFRDRPGTLHLRLVAPIADRVARVCRRLDCNAKSAVTQVRQADEDRNAYIRRYHEAEWRDPLLYDLEINTGRIAIPVAVDLVARLVEVPTPAGAG